MKRRAPPPSPLDLALSSLTNLTPNGAVRGVAPGYKPKIQSNIDPNAYASPAPKAYTNPNRNYNSTTNTNTNANADNSGTTAYTNLNLNPYASADAYVQAKKRAEGDEGERSYDETFQLGMAKFWAQKAQALKEPFMPVGEEIVIGNSGGGQGGVEWISTSNIPLPSPSQIQPQAHQRSTPHTPETTPLNNDTIAEILTTLKPTCPKAQSWVQAHHAAKAAQAQLRAKMREREGLRKQVLQKLREKTLKALRNANPSKEEVREVLGMLPAREEVKKGEGGANVDLEMDMIVAGSGIPGALGKLDLGGDGGQQKQFIRVSEAHAKLQKVMREIADMNAAAGTLAGSEEGSDEEDQKDDEGDSEDESDNETIDDFSEGEDEGEDENDNMDLED
ncbi:hypothetical protein BJX64DRAFT_283666 [Aspergillus heterothallicus]